MLEQRILMSATPAYVVTAGNLDAQLTDGNDQFVVTQLAGGDATAGYNLRLALGSVSQDFTGIKGLTVRGLGGNDAFEFITVSATLPFDASFDGGAGTDTLKGQDATDNKFDITAMGAGTLAGGISFTGVENLTGGARDDVFAFADQAGVTGAIDGGLGSNALDFSAYATSITVNLGAQTATGTGGARNFDNLIGGKAADTVIGLATDTTWRIDEENQGQIIDLLDFSGIENLTGTAAARDSFIFGDAGTLTGAVDGGAGGIDGLVVYKEDGSFTVVNARAAATTSTAVVNAKTVRYINLEPIVGGTPAAVVLTGSVLKDIWTLGDHTVAGQVALTSNAGDFFDDTLATPAASASLVFAAPTTSITVRQREGNDSLSLGALSGAYAVSVDGGDGDDSFLGNNVNRTWSITGVDAGTVGGYGHAVAFSQVERLVGGTGDDNFAFANGVADLSVGADGGQGGTDTLDYSARSAAILVRLGSGNDNIDRVIGTSSGADTLIGANEANVWTVGTANNAGTVVTTTRYGHRLDSTIVVDATADTITFAADHGLANGAALTYTTAIVPDGSGLTNGVTYYAQVIDSRTIKLGLTAAPASAVANLSSTAAGSWGAPGVISDLLDAPTIISNVAFSGIENLVGNVASDDFIFSAGRSVTGSVDGGGGANSLDVSGFGGGVTIDLGAGASTVASGLLRMARVTGTSFTDTLRGPNGDARWNITGANAGAVNGIAFTGFENLTGADNNEDGFVIRAGGSVSGLISGGANGFDGLAIENPAVAGELTVIVPAASGAGAIPADQIYAGVSALAFSGLEAQFTSELSANVLTLRGTSFDDQFVLTQNGAQLILTNNNPLLRMYSAATSAYVANATSATLPSGTLAVELSEGDSLSVGVLDTAGANLNISIAGNSSLAFIGSVFTHGGYIAAVVGANSDNNAFVHDRGSITVNAGVTLSTRQTALNASQLTADSTGNSGDITFLSGVITVNAGARLLAHDTRTGVDPLGVPASIGNQSVPEDKWQASAIRHAVPVTGGHGTGMTVDVETDVEGNPIVILRDRGTGYQVGDVVTIEEPGLAHFGSDITVTVTALARRGGDIQLLARDDVFAIAYDPNTVVDAQVLVDGATLKGRDVVLRATANNDMLFEPDQSAPPTNRIEQAADTAETLGKQIATALADFFINFRLLGGYARSTANASVIVTGPSIVDAVGGSALLEASANSEANVFTLGIVLGGTYARSDATSTVAVRSGASVSATEDVVLMSSTRNVVSAKTKTINTGKLAKSPLSTTVTFLEAFQLSTATIDAGATVSAGGDVHVIALSTRSIEGGAEGATEKQTLGVSVAVTMSEATATASIDGAVTAGGDVRVTAQTVSTVNRTAAKFQAGEPTRTDSVNKAMYGIQRARLITDASNGDSDAAAAAAAIVGAKLKARNDAGINKAAQGAAATDVPQAGKSVGVITTSVALHQSSANARIGGSAVVTAGGGVSVLGSALDRPDMSTQGLASVFKNPAVPTVQGERVFGVAVSYGDFDNSSSAIIAGGAHVNAAGAIRVDAHTVLPYETRWDHVRTGRQFMGAILQTLGDANLGADGYVTSWTQSLAEGNKKGYAISAGILVLDNKAEARIESGAVINGPTQAIGAASDVTVSAQIDLQTVSLAGNFKNILDAALGTDTGKTMMGNNGSASGVGGSFMGSFYSNVATAVIESGATIRANEVRVAADTEVDLFAFGLSGGSAGDSAINGVVNYLQIDNHTLARVDDGASINASGTLDVTAHDDAFTLNIAGGVSIGKSVGFGITAGATVLNRDTHALIGNEEVSLGHGSFAPGTGVNSTGDTIDLGYAHHFANGDTVVYSNGGADESIDGLTDGTLYYVTVVNATTVKLSTTSDRAASIVNLDAAGMRSASHNLGKSFGAAAVASAADTISLGYTHGFVAGQEVMYSHGGDTAVGGLANKNHYYVVVVNTTTIRLADTRENALRGVYLDLDASKAVGTLHSIGVAFQARPLVDAAADTLRFDSAHAYRNGQAVVYENGGGVSIGGLTDGATYYVKVVNATTIELYTNAALTTATRVNLDPAGATGTAHALLSPNDANGVITSGGKTTVSAENSGLVITATVAAAKTDDKPPTDPEAAKSAEAAGGQKHGRAVAGSVSVNIIHETAEAYVQGAALTNMAGLDVLAEQSTMDIAVSGAAALSTNKNGSLGVAGAVSYNDIDSHTLAFINDSTLTSVGDVLVDADASGSIFSIAAGLGGSARGVGIAGSVAINTISSDTAAYLRGGSLSGTSLNLSADDNTSILTVAGAIAFGGSVGFGAGIAYNEIDGGARAFIDDTDVDVTGALALSATSHARITSVAAGVAVVVATPPANQPNAKVKGFAGSVALTINNISTDTSATIGGDSVDTLTAGSVSVAAVDDSVIKTIAGSISVGLAGGTSGGGTVAAGVALALNNIDHDVTATIEDVVLTVDDDVTVSAASTGEISVLALGGALAVTLGGASGTSAAVAATGAVAINKMRTGNEARIRRSSVTTGGAGDDITIAANDSSEIHAGTVGAAIAVSQTGNGTAVSVAVGVSLSRNEIAANTRAFADSSTLDAGGKVGISATSTADIEALSVAASVAIAVGSSALAVSGAGAESTNVILGDTLAYANASTLIAGGDVTLTATDTADIDAIVAAAAVGAGSIGAAVSNNYVGVTESGTPQARSTRAYLNATSVDAEGLLNVSAKAEQDIDALVIAAAVGFAAQPSGGALSLAGSGVITRNRIVTTTKATIDGTLDTQDISADSITVAAENAADIHASAIAAALGASFGSSVGVAIAIGVSLARNDIDSTVDAHIATPADVEATAQGISVTALDSSSIEAKSLAASLALGFSGGVGAGVSGAGAESSNFILSKTHAYVQSAVVHSAGDIVIDAKSTSKINAEVLAVSVAVGVGAQAGLGAAIGASLARNSIGFSASGAEPRVEVLAWSDAASLSTDGNLTIRATGDQTIDTKVAAGAMAIAGGGTGAIGLSGSGASADNRISAIVHASITGDGATGVSADNVTVTATDSSRITAFVGAASLAGTYAGAGAVSLSIAAAVASNRIRTDVEAYVSAADTGVKASAGDIKVEAQRTAIISSTSGAASASVAIASTAGIALSGAGAGSSNAIGGAVKAHADTSRLSAFDD
ncbi:MAG TPA: hypothetical protein VLJ62_06580, partial [Burkholderiaceae bacterium]|nr:hypothetical protein [Burkholderiaceae bacterium]